jgi:hypothetical protein
VNPIDGGIQKMLKVKKARIATPLPEIVRDHRAEFV